MAKIVEVFIEGYSAFYVDGERVYQSEWETCWPYRVFKEMEKQNVTEFEGFEKKKADKDEFDVHPSFPKSLDDVPVE